MPLKYCRWKEADDHWETDCGEAFILLEGDPLQNKMKFCPYCGLKIKGVSDV